MATKKMSQAQAPDPSTNHDYTAIKTGISYVDVDVFAAMFNLNASSVRRQCRQGHIPGAVKFGGLWRIPVKEEQ